MLNFLSLLALVAATCALSVPAQAAQAEGATVIASAPGRTDAARAIKITATVTPIDELHLPDVNHFNMIAVGDKIEATYAEAVAVMIEPAARK